MTPEERLNRIEKALDKHIEFVGASLTRNEAEIEKQNAAIRDLIVAGRTCIDAIQGLTAAQQGADERLNTLTENVDKLTANVEKLVQGRAPHGHQV